MTAPPDTPRQRRRALEDLYAHLATAGDPEATMPLVGAIERLWLFSGSDTIDVLMERVLKAVGEQRLDLAEKLSDTIVELEPGFAEGWNRKALVAYLRNDYTGAMDALRRTLALEPNHFKALDGLAQIMRDTGEKKAALKAYRKLLDVHPYWQGANDAVEALTREVEGQGI
ncbi:MAG: tetratricopeptide repeat protein [Hyphomicrobiaceae bacterium]|nr:tetratricopeptide repeat protein [Hyphomicrobiaceae bacterium]